MNWFHSIFYGLISGIAQFLPISATAHQKLYLLFSGAAEFHPLQMLLIHIGCIAGILTNAKHFMDLLLKKTGKNYRSKNRTDPEVYDLRMVKTASVPLLLGFTILYLFKFPSDNLIILMVLFLINGIALYIPERMLRGNKDARFMSVLDSYLIGISGSLSALPGISGVGFIYSSAIARGADRKHAFRWTIMLSFYVLCAMSVFDVVSLFSYTGESVKFISILYWLLSALFAYLGSCISIRMIQFLSVRNGISGFAYYSWGAALLVFILYLTVV